MHFIYQNMTSNFFFLIYISIQLIYSTQYLIIKIINFEIKKSKAYKEKLVTSYYIIKDIERYIIFNDFISAINEQNL